MSTTQQPEPHTGVEPVPPLLHTPTQAARVLAVKESWLRRQAGRRTVPSTKLGKHLRFSDADLEAISKQGHRPARTVGQARRLNRRR